MTLIALSCLVSSVHPAPVGNEVIYFQDFRLANSGTGLPPGWSKGPSAHVPFFSTHRSEDVFGEASPSLAVELPARPINYRVATPYLDFSSLNEEVTLEFALRLEMPDATFFVESIAIAPDGSWLGPGRELLVLGGETMDGFRTYRVSFQPWPEDRPGRLVLFFGLSYKKVMREGRFWLDDLRLVRGRTAADLAIYPTPFSAATGDPIHLHVSSGADVVRFQVFREGASEVPWTEVESLVGCRTQPVPPEVWRVGCDWPIQATIQTEGWPSGVYTIRADNGDQTRLTHFFLHAPPGASPPVPEEPVVIFPLFTSAAYNGWGGRSFYGVTSTEVSFERPQSRVGQDFFDAPVFLIRWLERTGQRYRVATDFELHEGAEYLRAARTWIVPWHSEYWTREMRRETEAFVALGGNVIVLGGNVLWWQSRLVESDDPVEPGPTKRLVCYKYAAANDPYWAIDSSRVTTHWDAPPLNESAIRLLGLSWRTGGMVNWSTSSSCPCEFDWLDGHGGYSIAVPDHWIFAGTGLEKKDILGQGAGIVGYEVDGVPHEWILGVPVPAVGAESAPETVLLGHAGAWNQYHPDNHGDAFMAIRETAAGGVVFHAGTTGWCWGLHSDPQVQQVTWNLLHRAPTTVPDGPGSIRLVAFPNPASESVGFRWSATAPPETIELFAVDGRLVRRLTWGGGIALWNFQGEDGAEVRPGVYFARAGGATSKVVRVR